MIRILIVEDEIPAQVNLKRLIEQNLDDVSIVGCIDSIEGVCNFIKDNGSDIDLIFMDVELSDGKCFEIFNRIEIKAKIIITTAFDNYAIKAFKINSIDYLLKPINPIELVEAFNRAARLIRHQNLATDGYIQKMIDVLLPKEYKQRITVRLGDKILIFNVNEIAYFYSEDKVTFVVTNLNKRYIIDPSLDAIIDMLNPKQFFRVTRGCIASISSIKSVSRHLNGRLKVALIPNLEDVDIFVSRLRTPDFMNWLES